MRSKRQRHLQAGHEIILMCESDRSAQQVRTSAWLSLKRMHTDLRSALDPSLSPLPIIQGT